MNAKQLNCFLIDSFPELKQKYHEEVDWQEGDETGSHIVYGDVFTPYVEEMISKNDELKLQKIFMFIETILKYDDIYSDEVIMFSVLEGLLGQNKELKKYNKYFGEKTKRIVQTLIENERKSI